MKPYVCTRVRVIREISCNCPAFKYPHAVGYGECKSVVTSKPPIHLPRKGIAARLLNILYDDSIQTVLEMRQQIEDLLLR